MKETTTPSGKKPLQKWRFAKDAAILTSATKDWDKYSSEVKSIIEAEAKRRGLWQYILHLRGEKAIQHITADGILEGFVCERCKETRLNPQTGRCATCNTASGDFGFCKQCDTFWPIPPDQICPEHATKLSAFKAVTTYRRIDNCILDFAVLFFINVMLRPLGVASEYNLLDSAIFALLFVMYYLIFETLFQRTPAKFITGTKVVNFDGTKPTLFTILKRTLIRIFIPFEALSFLGEKVYGWHDRWSGTYVIRAKRFESREAKVSQESFPFSLDSFQQKMSDAALGSFIFAMIPFYFLPTLMFAQWKPDLDEHVGMRGIFYLLITIYILALVLGLKALKNIKKSCGLLIGRGLALTGSIMASLLFASMLVTIVVALFTAVRVDSPKYRVIVTNHNLKLLHKGMWQLFKDKGRFPTEKEGLETLLKKNVREAPKPVDVEMTHDALMPDKAAKGDRQVQKQPEIVYFKYGESTELPKDGWGREFIYKRNPKLAVPFVIISYGADGKEGGTGYDADLFSTNPDLTK